MDIEILDSYESYKEREDSLSKDRSKIAIGYADYPSGTFGMSVMEAPVAFSEEFVEKAKELAALKAEAKVVAFRKFGVPLVPTAETRETLADLLSDVRDRRDLVTVNVGGVPTFFDYSTAASGTSRVVSVSPEAYRMATNQERLEAALRFTGHDWRIVLGYMSVPDAPGRGMIPPGRPH